MLMERDPTTTIGVIMRSGWRRQAIDAIFGEGEIPARRWDLALDDPSIVEMIRSAISRLPKATGFDAARDAILDSLEPADVDTMEQVQDGFEQLKQVSAKTPRGAIAALRNANPEQAISLVCIFSTRTPEKASSSIGYLSSA